MPELSESILIDWGPNDGYYMIYSQQTWESNKVKERAKPILANLCTSE